MTSLERTVIDSIADLEKIAGLEELLRCLLLIPFLSPDKLLEALALHGKAQLYQKAGFILEAVNDSLSLPESFFAECASRSSAGKFYLFAKRPDFVLHSKWKLFAPKYLSSFTNKGVNYHDAF